MSFLQFLKKRKQIKTFTTLTGGEIKAQLAFIWKGIKYYQVDNIFEMSTGRALCAVTYYEEFQMRCDREYLEKHCRAIDILLSDNKKLMIGQIAIIHEHLKERVALAPYPDHIYKLASVMFFDDHERPDSYDFKYNMEKIAAWKEDASMLPFLVEKPLKALMPFGEHAEHNFQTYFQVKEAENQLHLRKLDEILSGKL